MKDFLQFWGGFFFLLNKFAFSASERSQEAKKGWKIASWIFYLIGLPAWLVIFVIEHNWIVLLVEASGIIPVSLALYIAANGLGKEPKWLDHTSKVAAVVGIALSIWDFGGFFSLGQILEMGSTIGFLVGTYLLAKEKRSGYLWYLLMNGSMGVLVAVEGYWWLAAQQTASLLFVLDAYNRKKKNETVGL